MPARDSGGGEEETRLYMKYYADEETRGAGLRTSPVMKLPLHEEPPYDRDRFPPQTHGGAKPVESDELM